MRAAGIAFALVAAACEQHADPCFTPQSKIEDLRVLGIAVDPPDPVVDFQSGTIEPVRLSALIVEPGKGSTGSYHVAWALCVPSTTTPGCANATVVMSDPEWKRDSSVELHVPRDLIAAAEAADPLHGFGGIRVLAERRVDGANPATATTPIIFSRTSPAQRNHPPAIAGLRVTPQGGSTGTAPPPPNATNVFVGVPTGLRPVLLPGAMEEYDTVDLDGNRVHLQERIRYSFYATPGLSMGRLLLRSVGGNVVYYPNGTDVEADEPPPGTPDTPGGLMLVEAVRRGGVIGTIWIVARDSRGATSWLEVPVAGIEVDPNCQTGGAQTGCPELDFGCL
ncbi:MAG: hypothetical protein ACJ79P_09645 [Myxococcales bacterium]